MLDSVSEFRGCAGPGMNGGIPSSSSLPLPIDIFLSILILFYYNEYIFIMQSSNRENSTKILSDRFVKDCLEVDYRIPQPAGLFS